jgi:DNA-directed RNA polymerase subunit E'/Rpb7
MGGSDTSIYKIRARLEVDLPPASTRDIQQGVRDYLASLLLRYSRQFQGVVLAYEDERILSSVAPVGTYFTYVHVALEARLSVFRPEKGECLLGTVNKIGSGECGLQFRRIMFLILLG